MTRAATFGAFGAWALFLLASPAQAGGDGTGIPETGGPGAGAASEDARGLSANPAAAVGAGGSEAFFDFALEMLQYHYQRAPAADGTTYPAADHLDPAPVPYLAFRTDAPFRSMDFDDGVTANSRDRYAAGDGYKFGESAHRRPQYYPAEPPLRRFAAGDDARLGIGISIAPVMGRQVHLGSDDPARYYLVDIDYFTAYVTPAIAWRPVRGLAVGAGPVLAITKITGFQRTDMAPQLNAMLGGSPAVPGETGLLEGSLDVPLALGYSYAWTVGVLADLSDKVSVGAAFIAGSTVTARGDETYTPSKDFSLYSTGNFAVTKQLPPIVNAGIRIRPASVPLELSLEGQWTGWSVAQQDVVVISGSQLHSTNATLNSFLTATGLSQGQLSSILNQQTSLARGYRDALNGILGIEYKWSPIRSRFEVGYDQSAVPDANVNPGNLDFDTVVLGAEAIWEPPRSHWTFGVAVSQYLNAGRTVTQSNFSSGAPVQSGYAYPDPTGTYSAVLTALRVNTSVRW